MGVKVWTKLASSLERIVMRITVLTTLVSGLQSIVIWGRDWGGYTNRYYYYRSIKWLISQNIVFAFLVIPVCIFFFSLFNLFRRTYNHIEFGFILITGNLITMALAFYGYYLLSSKETSLETFHVFIVTLSSLFLLYVGYIEVGFNKRMVIVNAAERVDNLLTEISTAKPDATVDEVSAQFVKKLRTDPDTVKRLAQAVKAGGLKAIEAYSNHPMVAFALGAYESWDSKDSQDYENDL